MRLQRIKSTGFLIGQIVEHAERYDLVDGNGDGWGDEMASKVGDDLFRGLAIGTHKTPDLTTEALAGRFGFVGLKTNFLRGGRIEALGFRAKRMLTPSGTMTETRYDGVSTLWTDGEGVTVTSDPTMHATQTFSVDIEGRFMLETDRFAEGFASLDGNVIVHFGSFLNEDGNALSTTEPGITLGVRLAEQTPDLLGKQYRLFETSIGLGSQNIQLSSISSGQLVFNDGAMVSLKGLHISHAVYDTASGQAKTVGAEQADIIGQPVSIDTDGTITIEPIFQADGKLEYAGFVSADGALVVLRKRFSGYGLDRETMGIIVGVQQ